MQRRQTYLKLKVCPKTHFFKSLESKNQGILDPMAILLEFILTVQRFLSPVSVTRTKVIDQNTIGRVQKGENRKR